MKIKIGLFSIFLICLLLVNDYEQFPALLFSVALHEFGHMIMAKLCGIPLKQMKLDLLGAAITPKSSLYSYKKEVLLCLGGPAMNFICVILLHKISYEPINSFVLYSLSLGSLNLMPISGFDGGRILFAVISSVSSVYTAARIIKLLSFFLLLFMWTISVYLLLTSTSSLSLFVFSASIFSKLFIHENGCWENE